MGNGNSLEINPTAIYAICSRYNEMINTLGADTGNVADDFRPLVSCGVLTSYIPDLKDTIDKVILAAKEMVSYIEYFAQEQENIDNNNYDDKNNGGGSNNGGQDNKVLSDQDIVSLFSSNDFLNSLVGIVKQYPNILSDSSMYDKLKELLLKSNANEDIIKLLNGADSEIIQSTLLKIINGEIVIQGAEEIIEKIKNIMLGNVNSDAENAPITEAGTYEDQLYTASNGAKIEFDVHVPEKITAGEDVSIRLIMLTDEEIKNYNIQGLSSIMGNQQDSSTIVIFPKGDSNVDYSNTEALAIKELIDQYAKEFNCDESKMSITGQKAIDFVTQYKHYFKN